MWKLFVVALLLLLGPMLAPAQTTTAPSILFTRDLQNGRIWLQLADKQKESWILGYVEGIHTAAAAMNAAEPGNEPALKQSISPFMPSDQLTEAELIEAIDHFYRDTPENGPVPIIGAMIYVKRKASGATQAELNDLATSLRRANATPENKP